MYGRYIEGSAVSVRCPELGGVRFSEVSFYSSSVPSWALVRCTEVVRFSGCPL